MFDSVTHGLLTLGKERGLTVKVYPAVSSIDTIMVDLEHEVAPGLQIYDATWLVGCSIEPRVDIPCLLLQTSVFGTAYVAAGYQPRPHALVPLRDHLLQFYPGSHEIAFVSSAEQWYGEAGIYRLMLQDLGTIGKQELQGTSLFIPRLRDPNMISGFLERMNDRASLTEAFELE